MDLYFAYLELEQAKRVSSENARTVDRAAQTMDTISSGVPAQTPFTCDSPATR
jgi:hypothetical protein